MTWDGRVGGMWGPHQGAAWLGCPHRCPGCREVRVGGRWVTSRVWPTLGTWSGVHSDRSEHMRARLTALGWERHD